MRALEPDNGSRADLTFLRDPRGIRIDGRERRGSGRPGCACPVADAPGLTGRNYIWII